MAGVDEINFPHNLSLTNKQVEGLHTNSPNSLSRDIKLSRTRTFKIIQSVKSLDGILGSSMKVGVPLIKNVF